MRLSRIFVSTLAAVFLLAACATNGNQGTGINKNIIGMLLGGAGGGYLGSQFGGGNGKLAFTAAGALLGAYLGGEIGSSLDRADQLAQSQAAHRALESVPSGQTVNWRSPDSARGNRGSITPLVTYQESSGRYCREYQTTVTVGGETEQAYGTACRQSDGSWEIVDTF